MDKCIINGCDCKTYRRQMCGSHYRRFMRHGDPHAGRRRRADAGLPLKFLEENAHFNHSNDCLIWPFSKGRLGYGNAISYNGKQRQPHNIMARMVYGEPTDDKRFCCHSCHNPSCVNPSHLKWGDHDDNMEDMARAGRAVHGACHLSAKFDECAVRLIRLSKLSSYELSQFFRVNISTIKRIKNGKNWKHLKEEIV